MKSKKKILKTICLAGVCCLLQGCYAVSAAGGLVQGIGKDITALSEAVESEIKERP